MKIFPDKLQASLKGSIAPVYLIAGPEALLVEESADAVRSFAKTQGIDERVVIEVDARFDWDQLTQATETGSLFSTRRLVELRMPTGKPGKEGGAALRDWVGQPQDDVLLIKASAWEIASEKTVWFKALEQAGVFVPCWNVKPQQLPQWIDKRLSSKGLRIDQPAAQFLAQRLEGNLLAAAQEVERLSMLYPAGHPLSLDNLKQAVEDNARFDAFRLTELVFLGQTGQALRSIRVLKEADTPPPMIVSALSRELQTLGAFVALARAGGAQAAFTSLRIWPARQGPMGQAAKRLKGPSIGCALAQLSALDRISKSNEAHRFWVGLERLCVALCTESAHHALLEMELLDVA